MGKRRDVIGMGVNGPVGILTIPFTCFCGVRTHDAESFQRHLDTAPDNHERKFSKKLTHDEALAMHCTLARIRARLESLGVLTQEDFKRYEAVKISPVSPGKTAVDHRRAALALLGDLYLAMEQKAP